MSRDTLKWAGLAVVAAGILGFTSCSTTSGTATSEMIETDDGAIIVDTFTTTATVTGIDAAKRKVTLVEPNGHKTTYKCGPEVVNFSQIRVGDQVKATVTEQAAVYIGAGAPPSSMQGAMVALSPVGAKPGAGMVDTSQVTATVSSVDTKKHKVTLQMPDGATKKVKVGKKVDLSTVHPGDNVTVQLSEGLALSVQKP